jgi:hypothetical protein
VIVERGVIAERFEQNLLDRFSGREYRILGHVSDANPFAQRAAAGIGFFDPRQNFHQRGLARTVRADQPDVIAVEEREREILEKRTRSESLGDGFDGQENGTAHGIVGCWVAGLLGELRSEAAERAEEYRKAAEAYGG